MNKTSLLDPSDTFIHRHIGPSEEQVAGMLEVLGYQSLEELVSDTIPEAIRMDGSLQVGPEHGLPW